MSVDLKAADKETLSAALSALGLSFVEANGEIAVYTPAGTIRIKNGVATLTNAAQTWLNKIKRMYSVKTVEKVAKKYKFTVTEKANSQLVLRRY